MSQPDLTQLAQCSTVADFTALWADVSQQWEATTRRARRLPPGAAYERVDGEWSFVETLRHLVFATDGWIRRAVLGDTTAAEELYRAALGAAEAIDDPEDRSLFLSDLG